jgi:large subunit ribosomal protein L16
MQPKNTKSRKDQKASRKTKGMAGSAGTSRLSFGSYGLKTLEGGALKAAQTEAVRRVITRKIRKIGKI